MKPKKSKAKTKKRRLTSVELRPYVAKLLELRARRGLTKSEIINTALQEYLLEKEFQDVRNQLVPIAQAKGIYTDEDVQRLLT